MSNVVVIPSPRGDYVELGSPGIDTVTREKYPRFRKHILNLGTLKYQGQEFKLDESWYNRLKDNFNSGVSMCQVPLADEKNRHTENPLANTGEVVGLEREGNRVYTVIEVRKADAAQGLRDKTIMGASALLSMDYTDTRTQKKVGPALLHHCLTNRPYVLDLEPYQEIVSMSADTDGDSVIILSEGGMPETREELIARLRDQHGIDVEALQAAASSRNDTAALTAAITEALSGTNVQLSAEGSTISLSDVTGAIVELAAQNRTQGEAIARLTLDRAERDVDALIGAGRLLPKARVTAIELALTNPEQLDAITAPADAPYVQLSRQQGVAAPDGADKQEADVDAELVRLTKEHPELFSGDAKSK